MTTRLLDGLGALPAELDALGARRVLVVCTPGRRFVDRLGLDDRVAGVFDRAAVHVPRAVVDEAERALRDAGADTVVSIGGGAATGLGKALRLRHDVRFVAVPTTWSGSEMTRIWGTTQDGTKETGRDDRARPDVVVHDPALFATLSRRLTATSLLNALAHPIGALSAGSLDEALERQSLAAIRDLAWALDQLVVDPTSRDGIAVGLRGVRAGAAVLDQAAMGEHHKVAHLLGGALGLEHAALHAVLLPHTVRALPAAVAETVSTAAGRHDLPGHLYDVLVRVVAPRSLITLAGDRADALAALVADRPELQVAWVADAVVGRRPSVRDRRRTFGGEDVTWWGPDADRATKVIVALHGRGADAGSVARMVDDLAGHASDVAIVAPQADGQVWYPLSYRKSLAEHGSAVTAALGRVDAVLDAAVAAAGADRVWLFGFSQGACLACEAFARTRHPLAGLVAPAGARIGLRGEGPAIRRPLGGVPVLVGASRDDAWITAADLDATAAAFAAAGATVHHVDGAGDVHHVSGLQRLVARELLGTRPDEPPLRGFGNTFESEALPGALPQHQNTPRPAPYALHGEHISGTGFTATRADHRKLWLYRIRPSAGTVPLERLPHSTFVAEWGDADPNLAAWGPVPLPETPSDFVDGLVTLGGAGSPGIRRGYAVHQYSADRSMNDRTFSNADGDLLLVPWDGRITLLTEAGVLEVGPGRIAVVPRGVRFSVLVQDAVARGWVAEVYGRHFELPERGPVGANGLADARHFRAPRAWFEDRISPGYRVTLKHGNVLFQTTQDHSPYDVVAWYGNHVPWVYDLADFSPVMMGRVDHIDPSVHTVVHAGLDEPGASALDFVLFSPRWDVSEHTFRPPYFHRNAVTEINGVIADRTLDPSGPFAVGGTFVTPGMTPHGVRAPGVERALAGDDRPSRNPDGAWWFQFESVLPLHLTPWATAARIADWPARWGSYRGQLTDSSAGRASRSAAERP